MAIALDYQTVYVRKRPNSLPLKWHIAAGISLFIALTAKVWIKIECTDEGYRVARLRQEAVELDMERRELELQRSVLLKPDNLVMRSAKQLKLKPLNPTQAKRILY